jgi:hypothetical protein
MSLSIVGHCLIHHADCSFIPRRGKGEDEEVMWLYAGQVSSAAPRRH